MLFAAPAQAVNMDEIRLLEGFCFHEVESVPAAIKKCKKGIALVEKALQNDPENLEFLFILAEMLKNRDPARAKKVMDQILVIDPEHTDTLLNLAMNTQDYKKRMKYMEKIVKIDPEHPGAHYGLAQLWIYFGDGGKATEAFKNHIKLDSLESQDYDIHNFIERMKAKKFTAELPGILIEYIKSKRFRGEHCGYAKTLEGRFNIKSDQLKKAHKEFCGDKF